MVSPNIWIQLIHIQKKSQRRILRYRYHTWHTAKLRLSASGLLPRLQKSPQSRDAGELSPENFHRAKSTWKQENAMSSHWNSQGARSEPTDPTYFEGKIGNKIELKENGKIDKKLKENKIWFEKGGGQQLFCFAYPQVILAYNVSPDSCCHLLYKYQVRRYEYTQNE